MYNPDFIPTQPDISSEPASTLSTPVSASEFKFDVQRTNQTSFWIVAAATALALAASGIPSPLYVDYQAKWHFSTTTLTAIYACYAGGVVLTLLLLGGLSDRVGRRPVMIGSMIVLCLSMIVFIFAQDTDWLFVARAIQGLSTGIFTGAASAALSELHVYHNHRVASLVNSTVTSLGIALGAVLSGALAEWVFHPLAIPFIVVTILTLITMLALIARVPETAPIATRPEKGSIFRLQRLSVPKSIHKQFLLASLSVISAWSVGGLYLSLGGALAKELLQVNNHLVAGLVILCVQGIGGISQLLWNIKFSGTSERITTVFGCAALIVGMAICSGSLKLSSATLFLLGSLCAGVGFGITFMSGTRRITKAAPNAQRGEVMAAYFVIAYLAISIPSIIAGFLSTHIGLGQTFYLFALTMVLTTASTIITTIIFDTGPKMDRSQLKMDK